MKNDTLKGQYRINEQIRAKEVRIVGDDIEPKVYLFVVLLIILNFFIN